MDRFRLLARNDDSLTVYNVFSELKVIKPDPTIHVNITLSISDVPSTLSEQFTYFNNLKTAIRTVLNLSLQWTIEVSVIETSIGRRSGQYTNLAANIVFSSTSAGPGDSEQLQKKLASPAFLDGLSAMGFKASRYGVPSIQGDPKLSSESAAPSALTVGLSSAFGLAIGLTVLLCAYRAFARGKFQPGSGEKSKKLSPEPDKSGSEYSAEYDEVLQLIGRLNISVGWLVDAYLRQVVEARIEDCQDISAHDRAAALQLISAMELKENLDDQPMDRKMLLQQRVAEGPLTEIHSRILRQICRPETFEISLPKKGSSAEGLNESFKLVNEAPATDESDVTDGRSTTAASRHSVQDVLLLLKTCDLDPCQLMDTQSRRLMEEILTTRQEPLQAVHQAVLQLISKAEIDSDLCMDPMRRQLLDQRIKEGPLHAGHLRAARSLRSPESAESIHDGATDPKLAAEAGAPAESGADVGQAGWSSLLFLTENAGASANPTNAVYGDQSSLFLFSGEEKSALQRVSQAASQKQAARGALRGLDQARRLRRPSLGESDVTDGRSTTAAPQNPLQDVLSLLKTCDLDPCQLMHTESRQLMEEILTTRQEPLQAVHQAVLQLISKAEIDSDLCMDPMRRQLLEQRIKEGPLHAGHLRAARSLKMLGVLARVDPTANSRNPPAAGAGVLVESGDLSAAGVRQAGSRDVASGPQATRAPRPQEPSEASSSELVLLAPDGGGAAAPEEQQRMPFFRDSIFGLEVQASVQTAREKSTLALIELRAKTANIRRSLPEWVRGGLAPPRAPPPPSPTLLVQVDAAPADDAAAPREAVQISCEVKADLGFLSFSLSLYLYKKPFPYPFPHFPHIFLVVPSLPHPFPTPYARISWRFGRHLGSEINSE
jgi:hypothetical protein